MIGEFISIDRHWCLLILGETEKDYICFEFVYQERPFWSFAEYTKLSLDDDLRVYGNLYNDELKVMKHDSIKAMHKNKDRFIKAIFDYNLRDRWYIK